MTPESSRDVEISDSIGKDLSKVERAPRTAVQYILGCLLAFVALNAFGGGYYGMSGAEEELNVRIIK